MLRRVVQNDVGYGSCWGIQKYWLKHTKLHFHIQFIVILNAEDNVENGQRHQIDDTSFNVLLTY